MEDLLHKFVLNFIRLTSQMQVLYGLEYASLLWAGICKSFKFYQIFPGWCIFWLSCIQCWSKCIFCIECWRASSRNLSSFTNSHNSIDYCVDTHIFVGVFSRKSKEEVQEKKMLLEKLQVRMNEAEAKAKKLKVSFENLLKKKPEVYYLKKLNICLMVVIWKHKQKE